MFLVGEWWWHENGYVRERDAARSERKWTSYFYNSNSLIFSYYLFFYIFSVIENKIYEILTADCKNFC